ncbi:short-chain alcohol dehydrogenase [Mactra antiquata]
MSYIENKVYKFASYLKLILVRCFTVWLESIHYQGRSPLSVIVKMLLNILQLIFYYITTYIVGAWCLLIQICTKRNKIIGIPSQTGKVAIVTGGASGIGFYVSKDLVSRNIHVFIGGKCKETGEDAIKEIKTEFPDAKVDFIHLDLESLDSVSNFVENFLSRNLPLHILINNAGVMFSPLEYTCDNLEKQMQVNYLSHFYLTQLLWNKLAETGTEQSWSRIVNVSSYMHYIGWPSLETLNDRSRKWYEYSSHKGYADAKLMIIAAANKLNKQLREDNSYVTVNSLHPGVIQSGLWKHTLAIHRILMGILGQYTFLTTEQGADNVLYVALSPEVEGQSGCYYDNMKSVKSASLTYNEEFQNSLWNKSISMIENSGRKQ